MTIEMLPIATKILPRADSKHYPKVGITYTNSYILLDIVATLTE